MGCYESIAFKYYLQREKGEAKKHGKHNYNNCSFEFQCTETVVALSLSMPLPTTYNAGKPVQEGSEQKKTFETLYLDQSQHSKCKTNYFPFVVCVLKNLKLNTCCCSNPQKFP